MELMTHPIVNTEEEFLMSDEFQAILQRLESAVTRWFDLALRFIAELQIW